MKTPNQCPVCGEYHADLIRNFNADTDQPLLDVIRAEVPGWSSERGVCSRCVDQAHIELQINDLKGSGAANEVNGFKILPTPLRLGVDMTYTGRGVTICMIDSGFYLHPDLVKPDTRILHIRDITKQEQCIDDFKKPQGNAWHGTMTSVVCAGNGNLSNGLYRSIAPDANLVLLKVTDADGAITGENIVKAIDWAIAHAKQYHIRIINLSVTDDDTNSYQQNEVDLAVRRAVGKGMVVIAASGNDPQATLKAPATSPHAITVGGLNDRNTLDPLTNTLYHSTYGVTVDRIQKPDIIAPAIWLAAPILPGTKEQKEAGALFEIAASGDQALHAKLANLIGYTRMDVQMLNATVEQIRSTVDRHIGEGKYISPHYKHADGTSFAAPIVCAVIAQMLEANPDLDPDTIREILLTTARRIPRTEADRQGWGLISPKHAVQMAAGKSLTPVAGVMPVIDYKRMMIDFYLHQPEVRKVVLTGDFLKWSTKGFEMKNNGQPGSWMTSVPFSGKGVFRYKFFVDDTMWMSDPRNYFREPDGFNDFNSKIILQ